MSRLGSLGRKNCDLENRWCSLHSAAPQLGTVYTELVLYLCTGRQQSRYKLQVVAVDLSEKACKWAEFNAQRLKLDSVIQVCVSLVHSGTKEIQLQFDEITI